MNRNQMNWKMEAISLIELFIGCLIYSLSVVLFIDPVKIIPGSVTGIGVVVKALTGFPIGALNFIINVPLVIIGTIVLGKRLLVYTGLTVLLTSGMIDYLVFLKPFTDDVLLASVFGGVVMGIGLGMIMDAGGTTGGTTVVGRLVNKKKPDMPMGNILMIGDFIIIVLGSLLLKDWDLMLYSIIDLYVCVVLINWVLYGNKIKTLSIICSDKCSEIAKSMREKGGECILAERENQIILVSKKQELGKIQNISEKIDQEAFCVAFHADHSFGAMYHNFIIEEKEEKTDEIKRDYQA